MCPDQDENNKFFWRLARVKELLANSMRVRATIMSTRHEKTTRRALNHLYPLEVENEKTNPTQNLQPTYEQKEKEPMLKQNQKFKLNWNFKKIKSHSDFSF